jgi:Zn-finger nucleic acid-binding protein
VSGYRERPTIVRPNCPVCATPLVELVVGDGSGGGCQGCAGIWVDEAGLAAVRERVFADILAAAGPRTAPPRPDTTLACPTCGRPMLRTDVASVSVDVCPGHGTWFDPGELEMLAHAIAFTKNRTAIGLDGLNPPQPLAAPSSDARRTVEMLSTELRRSIDCVDSIVTHHQRSSRR